MLHHNKKHVKTNRNIAPVVTTVTNIILAKFQENRQYITIAIGGPGGSGKSTFSKKLLKQLQQSSTATLSHLDNYRKNRSERTQMNQLGSHPLANKIDLIKTHLEYLKRGKSFEYPIYNAISGTSDQSGTCSPATFNIIEGELSTHTPFRKLIDFTIFIDAEWETQLQTRLTRDIKELSFPKEKAVRTFLESNLIDFQTFGAEAKNRADIHLFSDINYYISIEAVSVELFEKFNYLFKDYKSISLDGDVYSPAITINYDGKANFEEFTAELDHFQDDGVERIIINECPLASFYLTQKERMELLSLTEVYFPGVIIYQLTNGPRETVFNEINALKNHSIDAFTLDLKFFEFHLGMKRLRGFICEIISTIDIPLFFFKDDLDDFNTYFVQSDKIRIAPIAKRKTPKK